MGKFTILIALVGAASPLSAQAPAPVPLAIVGATVIPIEGPDRLRDQTVLVSGDRITAIGPRRSLAVPKGARLIDGRGKFVTPGLVDMHVHIPPVPGAPGDAAQRALAVMLAKGITTVRGMAGSPHNLAVRAKVESGVLAGPRLYAAAPALHDKSAPTPDEARAKVRQAKIDGYDLVKAHQLTNLGVWQAVQDEAKAQRLPTAGHVTAAVGLPRAMAAGQQIEHLDGMIAILAATGGDEIGQVPPPPVIAAALAAGPRALDALARDAKAAASNHVPTLSLFEKIADVTTPTASRRSAPAMAYVPPATLSQWAEQRYAMVAGAPPQAEMNRFVALRRAIVAALHRRGVPIMAGSDTSQMFHYAGFALHEELAALHRAGLTNHEVLRAATIVPRGYFRSLPNGGSALGWKADFGTVTRGARADLLLLDSDPTANLAALERPAMVIAGGRAYDRKALDTLLDEASAAAKAAQ